MRLSLGLPLLETIAMMLILWAPWAPETHRFDLVLRDGREIREIRGWSVLPGPEQDTMAWAEGINLPALLAEIPIDLACERLAHRPERKLRFFSWWLFGSLSWYMIGRVGEDILKWIAQRKTSESSPFRAGSGSCLPPEPSVSVCFRRRKRGTGRWLQPDLFRWRVLER